MMGRLEPGQECLFYSFRLEDQVPPNHLVRKLDALLDFDTIRAQLEPFLYCSIPNNPEQYKPSAQAIRNWVAQSDRDCGRRGDGLTNAERDELGRLKRENRRLRQEREILAKAAAWFARETGSIPSGSSSS